ncbi:MAG: FeoA family protein [Candidatus Omnitrophota bacterium]
MEKKIVLLTTVAEGKGVTLVSIEGGQGLRRRLNDMGLNEGMKFKVMHTHRPGPCIIRVGDTRLVLGYGMAHKILVEET